MINMRRAAGDSWTVAEASPTERSDFIHKTYQHVALAIAVFIGLEAILLQLPGIDRVVGLVLASRFGWLAVLAAFMAVSWVAERWALSSVNVGKQYLGLGLFVFAEALIFLPLLYLAAFYGGQDVILKAGVTTGIVVGGLTAMVLFTKRDFSFLGGILRVVGFAALGLIVVSILFGFSLGSFFAAGMAVFAAGAIVYNTSNILHRYHPGQHVSAALSLFASIALLFWYLLSFFMGSRD